MLAAAAALIVGLALPGGAAAQQPASGGAQACAGSTVIPAAGAMRQAAADTVLCLLNGERARRTLAPLRSSALLGRAALLHSADMVRRQYFSHVSPSGQSVTRRAALAGYRTPGRRVVLGETLAWGAGMFATPSELVKELMSSAEHRAVILDGRYRDVGIGLALGAPMEDLGDSGATLSVTFGRR